MKSAERQASLKLLEQKISLYQQLEEAGSLGREDMVKYHAALTDFAKVKRIEDGFQSIMTFAQTYFKGSNPNDLLQVHTPNAEFHWELTDMLREIAVNEWGSKTALAAARSHSKSTFASNIFLVWVVCYAEDVNRYYWILLGDKQATAASQLSVVKTAFEENERIKADFGDLPTRTWNQLEIVTANGVKIQAAGQGEALRGLRHGAHRPNVLCDDLEGPDNVSTPEQIQKTLTWFDQTVTNLGDPKRSCYILVGTILHYQSLLATLINKRPDWEAKVYPALLRYPDRMELWDEWQLIYHDRSEGNTPADAAKIAGKKAQAFYEQHEAEMNEGANVLWPERMPLYEIMKQRATNSYAFSTELQCDPVDVETQVFKTRTMYNNDEINLDEFTILGGVDPSLKETKRSDPSAILVVGKSKTGIYYVLNVDNKKRPPDTIMEDLFTKTGTYSFKWVTCETVQFQQFFADELRKRSAMAGIYLNVKEFKSTVKKEVRIKALEPLITNGYIRFHPSQMELLEQLTYFPKVKHDDILDCLAQIIEMDRKKAGRGCIGTL